MVYIYAFVGRLVVYPYLMYRSSRLMSPRLSRGVYWILILELILSTLCLALHSWVMHPLMSWMVSANLFIFFSLGYGTAFLMVLNVLKWLIRQVLGPAWCVPLSVQWGGAVAMLGIVVGTMYCGYRNVAIPHVEHRQLHIPMADGQRADTLRLALLTDLHIGEGITQGYIQQAVELTMRERPDVILVGGDYIDHYSKYAMDPKVMQTMRRLTAPEGVYYVPGNHEYRADSIAKLNWVSQVGGTLLLDSIVYPRGANGYALIGRDDYVHNTTRPSLRQLVTKLEPRGLNILLEHTPEELDSLRGTPIHLALYGHTHGGQLFPNQLGVWLKYGIVYGSAQVGGTEVYVSSGIGSAGAPYRIGTRSELVIYDIIYPRLY